MVGAAGSAPGDQTWLSRDEIEVMLVSDPARVRELNPAAAQSADSAHVHPLEIPVKLPSGGIASRDCLIHLESSHESQISSIRS